MKLSTIKTSNYDLITKSAIDNRDFDGIYQTDLLSAAIRGANQRNVLITIINNQNTIAVAVMLELPAVIICECNNINEEVIKKANENEIVIFKTTMKSYEVIIDLYSRGLL